MTAGITQRLEVWNRFLRDIYDTQEVLHSGTLPCEWVYSDSDFHRCAVNLPVAGGRYVQAAAADLVQDADGRWLVAEDDLSGTAGAAYALQCRAVWEQVFPNIAAGWAVRSLSPFPDKLHDVLKHQAADGALYRQVVLLSPGRGSGACYEHSYLAQRMGVPLVENDDLIVLNSQVHLKTVGGLEPIDVIYRRVPDRNLDALEFTADWGQGISGLMMCMRKRTVSVCNAVGSGLANNRLIASQLGKLARFYLGEDLLLPSVERWWCGDPDCLEAALSDLGSFVVSKVNGRGPEASWECPEMNDQAAQSLRERLLQNPRGFVVEPRLPLNPTPVCGRGEGGKRHSALRLFTIAGRRGAESVLPLTRYAAGDNPRTLSIGAGGGIKDTWVLSDFPAPAGGGSAVFCESSAKSAKVPIKITPPRRQLRLSSRSASHFFWMGRYLERAEDTVRILRTIRQVQFERQFHGETEVWEALWKTFAWATGHPSRFCEEATFRESPSISTDTLLNRDNAASVANCLKNGWENGWAVREILPPKVAAHLARMAEDLRQASAGGDRPKPLDDVEALRQVEETMMLNLDAVTGAMTTHLFRDDRWHFWRLGVSLERSLQTLLVIQQLALGRPQSETLSGAAERGVVEVLLRMLACGEASSAAFGGASPLAGALRVILCERGLPRSVMGCLTEAREDLAVIFREGDIPAEAAVELSPLNACRRLLGQIEFSGENLAQEWNATQQERQASWVDDLIKDAKALCDTIVDRCFHHQIVHIH